MPNRLVCLLILLLAPAARAGGQARVQAPSGVLRGVVQDSADGTPIGYALIVLLEQDQRVFTSESGKFSFSGLGSGSIHLRIQQIGYRAETLALAVDPRGGPGPAAARLVVRLARQAVRLPEVAVSAKSCLGMEELGATAPEGGTILEEAFKNAERILTLERKYPFVLEFQRVVTLLDSGYNRIDGRVDTLRKDSRKYEAYRAGKVIDRGLRRETAASFTSSDIAGREFQRTHCFWYAGRDSVEGFPAYRIDFAPRAEVKTPDWAGSLLVDSSSMALLRAESRLVNLPLEGTNFLSAICTIFYQPIVPSLPQEFQVRCVSAQKGSMPHIRVERWLLINRHFLGKLPSDSEPPP